MQVPSLADPDVQPTDEQFAGLTRRAFQNVSAKHQIALQKMRESIAVAPRESFETWREKAK